MGVIVLVCHWYVECFQIHCSFLRRKTCCVTREYQFLEFKKKDYVKKDDYEQCLQTQLQQNYLVSNINRHCGQKAT
jgi:hypothetical protein